MVETADYYHIPISDPISEGSGFTRFSLPLPMNGKDQGGFMCLWNDIERNKTTYCHFNRFSIPNSENYLREKLIDEQYVDNTTIEHLVTLFHNECIILKEDKDAAFF